MVHNETDKQVKIIEENYFNNIDFDFGNDFNDFGRASYDFCYFGHDFNDFEQDSYDFLDFG